MLLCLPDSPVSKRVSPSIEDFDEEELKSSHDGSRVKGSYYVRNVQDSVVAKLPSTPKVRARNKGHFTKCTNYFTSVIITYMIILLE